MKARAFWVVGPGHGESREEDLPEVTPPDHVLIRTLATGISRGTEALVFEGHVPPTQYEAMRAPMLSTLMPASRSAALCADTPRCSCRNKTRKPRRGDMAISLQ